MNLSVTHSVLPNLLRWYPILKRFTFLMTGSILAQAFSLISIPILAYFYEPYSFGILANIVALGFISSIICLRYEIGIVLARSEFISVHIFTLSLFFCVVFSIFYLMLIYFFSSYIGNFINFPSVHKYSFYIFLYVLGSGLYQISIHWLIRNKGYKSISFFRLFQPIIIFILQALFYHYQFNEAGLVFGISIGTFISSTASLLYCLYYFPNLYKTKIRIRFLKASFFYFRNFFTYTTPYTLGGQGYKSLIVFLITRFFGMECAGLYSIAIRLIQGPMNLILQALSQSFLPDFSTKEKLIRNESLIKKTMSFLSWIGGFFMGVAFILMNEIITLLFGEKWSQSADICLIALIPYTLLIFEGWIDRSYDVIKKQDVLLIQEIGFNILSAIIFILTTHFTHNFIISLLSLNLIMFLYYLVWIYLLFSFLKFDVLYLNVMLTKYYTWMGIVSTAIYGIRHLVLF